MPFSHTLGKTRYVFSDLRELLAKATPLRSGDVLAGLAAESAEQRVAAQLALADLPLAHFLSEQVVPYESDEVTRLIVDTHNAEAFAPIRSFTVGELRNWLLSDNATPARIAALAPGLTPEMAASVSKLMRVQDLSPPRGRFASSRDSAPPSACQAASARASSPTTPPTRPSALPPPLSMACCLAPATLSSASTPPATTSPSLPACCA